MVEIGTKIQLKSEEILKFFKPVEGINTVYYGRVRNGKTYSATADILDLLSQGEVVYANWKINFDGFDERTSLRTSIVSFIFNRPVFYKYNANNFHYFHPDDIDIPFLGKLVNVHLFIDEGQWIFNSQIREQDPDKRRLILHGGHYCRTLNVITQRPVNIFKDIRSQISIWYKCEKRFQIGSFILFQRTPYQDMKDDIPDEEEPSGRPKTYIGDKKIFEAYNTHAMRANDAIERLANFEAYYLTRWQRLKLIFKNLKPVRRAIKARPNEVKSEVLQKT
jgi:hypothetical protein